MVSMWQKFKQIVNKTNYMGTLFNMTNLTSMDLDSSSYISGVCISEMYKDNNINLKFRDFKLIT